MKSDLLLCCFCVAISSLAMTQSETAQAGGAPRIAAAEGVESVIPRGFLVNDQCYVPLLKLTEDKAKHYLFFSPLKDGISGKTVMLPGDFPYLNKHRIDHGRLFASAHMFVNRYYLNLDFSELVLGRWNSGFGTSDGNITEMVVGASAMDFVYPRVGRNGIPFDYLPLSKDSVRFFMIGKHGHHALPSKNVHRLQQPETEWQFSSARYQAVWGNDPKSPDKKQEKRWQKGEWSDGETLEVAFTEPFHAYAMKDHYYFVTESGKVYYSPPLKKGEEGLRQVKPFWTDAKQPVKHIVTDTDGETPNLTYVFGDSARPGAEKKGEKFYFKLQGTEAKASYVRQEQLQAAPNIDEPLKSLLEYGRLIRFGVPAEAKSTEAPPPPPDESSRFWAIAGAAAAGCVVLSGGAYAVYRRR